MTATEHVGVSVAVVADDDQTVITLAGVLDTSTVGDVRPRLIEHAETGQRIAVELADIRFVDAMGLGALVGALKRARRAGGDVVLHAPSSALRHVFDATGLTDVFTIVDDAPNG